VELDAVLIGKAHASDQCVTGTSKTPSLVARHGLVGAAMSAYPLRVDRSRLTRSKFLKTLLALGL
jgi:hypothetical protein